MNDMEDRAQKTPEKERNFCFLSQAAQGLDMTVRDDQYDFAWLLDAVSVCRKKGGRFRLVDSGKTDSLQLEWLLEAGADLYTSSLISRKEEELGRLAAACSKGKAILAYLQQGDSSASDGQEMEKYADPVRLGRNGIFIYLSNKEYKREMTQLEKIAHSCREESSRLVYYHHGPLTDEFQQLEESGAWIHIESGSIQSEEDVLRAKDITAAARSGGGGLILHGEDPQEWDALQDLIASNVILVLKTRRFDFKSPYKSFERILAGMRLPFKAYYLYPDVML